MPCLADTSTCLKKVNYMMNLRSSSAALKHTQCIRCWHKCQANHDSIPADFQLTEDAKTASARAGLEDRVEKLKAARQTIKELAGVPAWRHNDGSTGTTSKLSQLPARAEVD